MMKARWTGEGGGEDGVMVGSVKANERGRNKERAEEGEKVMRDK